MALTTIGLGAAAGAAGLGFLMFSGQKVANPADFAIGNGRYGDHYVGLNSITAVEPTATAGLPLLYGTDITPAAAAQFPVYGVCKEEDVSPVPLLGDMEMAAAAAASAPAAASARASPSVSRPAPPADAAAAAYASAHETIVVTLSSAPALLASGTSPSGEAAMPTTPAPTPSTPAPTPTSPAYACIIGGAFQGPDAPASPLRRRLHDWHAYQKAVMDWSFFLASLFRCRRAERIGFAIGIAVFLLFHLNVMKLRREARILEINILRKVKNEFARATADFREGIGAQFQDKWDALHGHLQGVFAVMKNELITRVNEHLAATEARAHADHVQTQERFDDFENRMDVLGMTFETIQSNLEKMREETAARMTRAELELRTKVSAKDLDVAVRAAVAAALPAAVAAAVKTAKEEDNATSKAIADLNSRLAQVQHQIEALQNTSLVNAGQLDSITSQTDKISGDIHALEGRFDSFLLKAATESVSDDSDNEDEDADSDEDSDSEGSSSDGGSDADVSNDMEAKDTVAPPSETEAPSGAAPVEGFQTVALLREQIEAMEAYVLAADELGDSASGPVSLPVVKAQLQRLRDELSATQTPSAAADALVSSYDTITKASAGTQASEPASSSYKGKGKARA
ncbi:hypothetical protein IQ07DRAFT_598114 [Pyrenochaeta sp. DS3sAY3a]|nr:hypothetical protein IQ07DRAFT_598114 [Pyrenochaeta sp. DS3sAY3a]